MHECGISVDYNISLYNKIDTSNLVNGKPIYFYFNETSLLPSNFTNAGQVILRECRDSEISGIETSNCYVGIYLYYCNNIIISEITAKYNYKGIELYNSNNNHINTKTTLKNNDYGIYLSRSDYNTISGSNTIDNNDRGIYLVASHYNTISDNNTINYNNEGIYLLASHYNTITENSLNRNGDCFVELRCHDNIISNNLCINTLQEFSLFIVIGIFIGIITLSNIIIIKKKKKR
jgi:parallel beta-helix repeat protein